MSQQGLESYDVRLRRIEERSNADWVGQRVRLEVYIDGDRRDTLQQTLERHEHWNLGETTYRFADHIQLQLISEDDGGAEIVLAAFTIPAGATDPAGAEFEVAGERAFVLVYDVVQARAVGSADST